MVGPSELLLILVVILIIVLVVRGPKVLPQFGEAIGKTIKGFRDNVTDDSDKPDDDAKADGAVDTAAADIKADSVATDKDDVDTKPGA
ncbi:MAG: twin-arginine translocase TatA/TatE family subunit [Chloroflexota bacterium]|nr:twin-arginine translocase TatA/TatE family subunit [Chloroflexota bacterium]